MTYRTNDGVRFEIVKNKYVTYHEQTWKPATFLPFVPVAIGTLIATFFLGGGDWEWYAFWSIAMAMFFWISAFITCARCYSPHFHFFHQNMNREIEGVIIKPQYLSHPTYQNAISAMIRDHRLDGENFPRAAWDKSFKELDNAVFENRQIMQKNREKSMYRDFAEAVRIENEFLKGDEIE